MFVSFVPRRQPEQNFAIYEVDVLFSLLPLVILSPYFILFYFFTLPSYENSWFWYVKEICYSFYTLWNVAVSALFGGGIGFKQNRKPFPEICQMQGRIL